MKKALLMIALFPAVAFATQPSTHNSNVARAIAGSKSSATSTSQATGVGVGVGYGVGYGGRSDSTSNAAGGNSSATGGQSNATGGNSSASTGNSTSAGGSSASNLFGQLSSSVSVAASDIPNQAPAVFTTSSPSFSQRNCTPVGSVNASGPFGGLGVAFPMGGDTCDGLNVADKLGEWEKESGDLKLWLVQCNLMVAANDDLAEAFENSGYSCKEAYDKRAASISARAKQAALINGRLK